MCRFFQASLALAVLICLLPESIVDGGKQKISPASESKDPSERFWIHIIAIILDEIEKAAKGYAAPIPVHARGSAVKDKGPIICPKIGCLPGCRLKQIPGEDCPTTCYCDGPEIDRCSLPPKTGPCWAFIRSYFFNSAAGECQFFAYGGCGGNGNRFSTKEKCQNVCGTKPPKKVIPQSKGSGGRCFLPKETGPCKAYDPSYFFNSAVGECQFFVYGGCGGNDNRFYSKETCENTCGTQPPKNVGGRYSIHPWY